MSNSIYVLNSLNEIIDKVNNGHLSMQQAAIEFTKKVSKQQLIACIADNDMDIDDINACKEMLKVFYNYELSSN